MPHRRRGTGQGLCQQELLQQQQGPEVEAPEKEIPAGSVPDAGGRPHKEEVPHPLGFRAAVSPQGNIEVLPKPGRKGDVPTPPELRDAAGDIGVVKVGQELKAQHPPEARGHVRVAGEVEVDLESVGQDPQPRPRHREVGDSRRLADIPELPHVVGQEQLFRHAHGKDLHAGGKSVSPVLPAVDLLPQVLILDDGTRYQLGEEGHKGAEIQDVPLGPGIPPVDIDGVAHGLEGVEADADGQVDAQYREKTQADGLQALRQEVVVLEEEEDA